MTRFLELTDIGAGHERLVTGTDHDHDAHIRIVAQFQQRVTEAFPHVQRHGVALGGMIERDYADALANALKDFALCKGLVGGFGNVQHRKQLSL